ncbi:nitrite reductase (NADH) large subunit [Proteiniborus ethanoligenes]|uniref:Nitrite reductase (NADH) large subunit n=1 Tax=Proteiniborus ethanoligenes TaxID=415015 RepID=A0A1H3Q1K4_9FIRM|nr:FAD-dependent oxidoreductase [Proteiniborus ethanoligenes]TAH64119.1 MAG: NAD(P)/FAD-dependent oxidoreductase [Gottschalkiaceae bacterium]SDZ06619.1 nitrite reductase (NADH) large subunit [Proteiniborus ethanoligenes]
MTLKYVIIGNGMAGLSAAKEIRNLDKNGSITIISSEEYLTYYRLKLSHYISKTFEDKELLIYKEDWYRKNNIEVILEKIVENIDTDKKQIKLDDGKIVTYDKLLLANGSKPFVPPITGKFKEGVFALRTLKDLKYIKNYFEKCEDITVIGGGLLGLEAAWAIKQLGKKVNVVEFFPYLLPRQLDKEMADIVSKKLSDSGLKLYFDTAAEEILGEVKAEGLKFKDGGQIKTDAILFSAGIRPNIDLVRETSIEFDKGVKVDSYLKTNIEDVYAAGDIAEVNGIVLGLWTAATEQGKIAGANMTGENKEYKIPEPFTTLSIGDISLFSIGNVKDYTEVLKHDEGENHFRLFVADNKLVGGILLGDISKMNSVKKAVNGNMDISDLIKEGLSCKEIIEKL